MIITSFKVSEDKLTLDLTLTNVAGATTLSLWTYKTYRTEGLEIDLSDKLNGSASQTISITLAEAEVSYFDGVYFIEVSDGTDKVCAMAEELIRYKECLIEKTLSMESCIPCLKNENPELLNVHALYTTLILALEANIPQEVINIAFSLDKFCSDDCTGCKKYKNI
jgi:hypothetical protein